MKSVIRKRQRKIAGPEPILWKLERPCPDYRVATGDCGLLIYIRPRAIPHWDTNLLEFDVFESVASAAEQNATLHKNVCDEFKSVVDHY
jgi:hypothetical protein